MMEIDFRLFEEITLSETGKYKIYLDNKVERDQAPHVHLARGDNHSLASICIYDCVELAGKIPSDIRKDLEIWIDFHKSELLENWKLMTLHQRPKRIEWNIPKIKEQKKGSGVKTE
jgi:Domain of unknown function (DUF4160)